MAVSFIVGGNRKKPKICHKSLKNFIAKTRGHEISPLNNLKWSLTVHDNFDSLY
jgi:hypothetical protein